MLNVLLRSKLLALGCWITGATRKNKSQRKGALLGFVALMIFALISLGSLFFHIFDTIALPFYSMGLGWLYFALVAVFTFALMFIGCVFTAKAQLFDARDNDLLLSLPLADSAILISRLFMLAVINFVLGLLVMVPAGFVWFRTAGFPVMGAVAFLLSLLLILLFALALSALFGWIIHCLTLKISGNKALITTLFSLLLCGGYLYINFNMNKLLMALAADPSGAAEKLRPILPLYWMGKAIAEGDALCLLLSLILPVVSFGLMYALLSRDFLRSATATPTQRKQKYVEESVTAVSPARALFRREASRFFSCSAFILNAGFGSIFAPVGAVALLIKRGALQDAIREFPEIAAFIPPLFILGICFVAVMTDITAPSIALEGKSLWLARSLPCSTKEILAAKLKLHCVIGMPAVLLPALSAILVAKPSAGMAVLMIFIPEAMILLMGFSGLYFGVKFPNLDWTNETQAVKSSMGALATIGVGSAVTALPAIVFLLLRVRNIEIEVETITGLFAAVLVLLNVLFGRLAMTRAVLYYENL